VKTGCQMTRDGQKMAIFGNFGCQLLFPTNLKIPFVALKQNAVLYLTWLITKLMKTRKSKQS